MTRTKKLFVAAAILAAGYGVASLLGEPAAMLLWGNPPPGKPELSQPLSDAALSAATEYAPGELRLVPDARPIDVPTPEATLQRPERVPDAFSADLSLTDVAAVPASPPSEPDWFSTFNMNASAPRQVKLRNEAPRPIFCEPRTGVAAHAAPPLAQVNIAQNDNAPLAREQTGSASNAVIPADYVQDFAVRENGQMAFATSAPTSPGDRTNLGNPFVAPQPLAPLEEEESRTHIIVDGDSLARLAGRYLDDPRRGNEIYELNRHVLSDPELLPIGAELAIPSQSRLPVDSNLPQSALPGSLAVHSAARGGLVPVRPVPPGAVIVPRAQLVRPLPAP